MQLPNIQTIRLANLLLLLDDCASGLGGKRGSAAMLSRLSGVPQPYISQLKHGAAHSTGAKRTMGDDTARALEKGMGKPPGWMDHDHSGTVSDQSLRIYHLIDALTPEQRQLIMQTAEALAAGNNKPPPEDGPTLRAPKPRRH